MRSPLLLALLALDALAAAKPNIVLVLTDDQDIVLGSADHMPNLNRLLGEQGMTFKNGFVTTAVCCPSRSTILTGRYAHSVQVSNNSLAGNCSSTAWQNGPEKHTMATVLKGAGYRTLYAGKYLNNYGNSAAGGTAHIPPGWTDWLGLVGNSKYYSYTVSDNGVAVKHGTDYEADYLTDVVKRRALQFIKENAPSGDPLFLFLAAPSAHDPFTPAPQYKGKFAGTLAPRTPSWNNSGTGKHRLLREYPPLDPTYNNAVSDPGYEHRLETLLSVDDLIGEVVAAVEAAGLLANTFVFFASDHGYHIGQWGIPLDKRQLYETDIRVPFMARGPGIAAGSSTDSPALVIDLAPTFAELATGSVPAIMEGRSLTQVLFGTAQQWRKDFLVEYWGERGGPANPYFYCGSAVSGVANFPCDCWNNTYSCVRTLASGGENTVLCEFVCFDDDSMAVVQCPADQPEAYGEYYDLSSDFWQLSNAALTLDPARKQALLARLHTLKACTGQTGCNN
jgi:N-acetylglucosamine-6-sulfatase